MATEADQALHDLVVSLKAQIGADRCTLYLLDREKREVWSKVALGLETPEIRLGIHRGVVGYVARTGKGLNLKDAYNDPRFDRSIDRATGYRTKSMLTMAVHNRQNQVIGVLQALNKATGFFTPEDEDTMKRSCLAAVELLDGAPSPS